MDCPDQTDFLVRQLAIVEGAEAGRQWVENARQCADSVLVAGHNPAAYTSVDSAEDIHALFEALNVPRWNVYGASYGTRLALEYMRQHPSDIRSVVLEAVSPPQARLYEDDAAHTNRAIQYLIGQCATQPACNEAYPDLGSRLQTLIERLDKEPMLITRERPDGEGQIVVPVDDERLLSRIYSMLYSYEDIRYVPRLIDAYDRKVWTEINDEVDNRIRSAGDPKDKGEAMRMSVQCFEEAPFNDFAKADAEYANYPLLRGLAQDHIWQSNKEACNVWRRIFAVDETRDSDGDAVVSDLPTLILTGTFDPITPPAYARMVARKLANSHLFEFPRSGHGVLSDSMCAREIADSFLETPDIRPSTKCHLEGDELDFAAPAQMTEGR